MKFLKRFLITIVVLLLCIGIGLAIFLQVRKHEAEKQLVHKHSTSVVKVAVDDIIINVLWSEIKNGNSLKTDSIRKEKEDKSWDLGLKIPASLYFFSVNNDFKKIYTYQNLKDKKVFQQTILEFFKLDSTDLHLNDNYWWIGSSDNKMKCIGDDTNVLFSMNLSSGDYFGELEEMWTQRANLFEVPAKIDELKGISFNEDIVYAILKTKDNFSIDFEDGLIKTKANVNTKVFQANKDKKVRKMSKDDIFNAYINIDMRSILNTFKSFFDKQSLAKDLLIDSFTGYADVQLKKGDVLQQDTIITYEYTDDFETIERESIQEQKVPNLIFTIKGGEDLNNVIPNKIYYKGFKKYENGYVILSTSEANSSSIELINSEYFLNIQYQYDESFSKYYSSYPKLNEIESISVTGKSTDDSRSIFEGELRLKEKNLHPIISFTK